MGGEITQGFWDIVRLAGRAVLGGGTHSTKPVKGEKLSRADRKAQGAVETAKLRKENMAGLAVLGSLALLVIASFAAQASGGSPQRVSTISASDSKSLRRLFFGGQTTVHI